MADRTGRVRLYMGVHSGVCAARARFVPAQGRLTCGEKGEVGRSFAASVARYEAGKAETDATRWIALALCAHPDRGHGCVSCLVVAGCKAAAGL